MTRLSLEAGDFVVTADHLHSVPVDGRFGYCHAGARPWFARHGLNWMTFLQHGIPASVLLATGDALARRLVEHAKQQEAHDGRQQ
ncbi:Phage protein [plant metagenome]|uniref:Phage protein n=1 Tax=plant metagenome TaxID=1297885 RepID=A0A484QAT3_9ZZZZ